MSRAAWMADSCSLCSARSLWDVPQKHIRGMEGERWLALTEQDQPKGAPLEQGPAENSAKG